MSVTSLDEWRKKHKRRSTSVSQSEASTRSVRTGQKLTENDPDYQALLGLYITLFNAMDKGFTTKSKFAREFATLIAIAATEDLITTRLSDTTWGNTWSLTDDGFEYLMELESVLNLTD